jgi:hypothetical protein
MFDKSSERITLAFSKLNDALSTLETVIKRPSDPDSGLKSPDKIFRNLFPIVKRHF